MLGTGGTPLYTLGTAFIDDSVPIHKSSLYIGKFAANTNVSVSFHVTLGKCNIAFFLFNYLPKYHVLQLNVVDFY